MPAQNCWKLTTRGSGLHRSYLSFSIFETLKMVVFNFVPEHGIYQRLRKNTLEWLTNEMADEDIDSYNDQNCDQRSWFQKWYVDPHLSHVDRTGTTVVREIFHRKELFQLNPVSRLIPSAQLLVGDAGFGKTILCCKIVYDWATDEEEYMKKFDLVVFGDLRRCNCDYVDSLDKWILQMMTFQMRLNPNDCLALITQCGSNAILLVLDGFSEGPLNAQEALLNLVAGRKATSPFHGANILVAARYPVSKIVHSMFDRSLLICGFDQSQENDFVERLNVALDQPKGLNPQWIAIRKELHKGIQTSPLLVKTLFSLKLPGNDTYPSKLETATDVLTLLVTRLMRRLAGKENENLQGRVIMNDDETNLNPLVTLGEFCHSVYQAKHFVYYTGNLVFTLEEAEKQLGNGSKLLLSIGAFHRISTLRGERNVDLYQPTSPTLMAYFIALYLESCARTQIRARSKVSLPSMTRDETLCSPSIVRFLCGRLGPLSCHVFRYLETRVKEVPFNDLCLIVNDCRNVEATIAASAKLAPKIINLENHFSDIVVLYQDVAVRLIESPCYACEILYINRVFDYDMIEEILLLPLSRRVTPLKEIHTSMDVICCGLSEMGPELADPPPSAVHRWLLLLMKANVEKIHLSLNGQAAILASAKLEENPKFSSIVFHTETYWCARNSVNDYKAVVSFSRSLVKIQTTDVKQVEVRITCNPSEHCITNLLYRRKCCNACQVVTEMANDLVEIGEQIKTKCAIFKSPPKWLNDHEAFCDVKKNATSLAQYLQSLNEPTFLETPVRFDKDKADLNHEELATVAVGILLRSKGRRIKVQQVLDENVEIDPHAPGRNISFWPRVNDGKPLSLFSTSLFNRSLPC